MRITTLALLLVTSLHAAESPFRVPEGFKVTKFAGDQLTHDTYAMTISDDGRVAVSGPGYIKVLLDSDKDGIADKVHPVTSDARNPHGLLWIGRDLLSVQPQGIFRHRDRNGDGLPDGNPELFYQLPGGGGEHGPHGIRKGPDGWFYLACGNNTKIGKANVTTTTSPIKDPSQGTVLRISPDGKKSEVIAHGFRNHYDIAFNKHGHLFTFDSDGERDHQLPWYSYCRVFHVRVGGHHGWLLPGHQRSFNRPPYFFDSVDRLAQIDRGSPTGVEVYRHNQFPKPYHDGLFYACWTYGRVYFTPLIRDRYSYQHHETQTFLETTGNLGFAPSDIAVHPPSGDLFVSVGGRGTQGSVYRISYPARSDDAKAPAKFKTGRKWSIHDDLIAPTRVLPPADALALFKKDKDSSVRLTAIRHLMLALGDISTKEAKRQIDAGYTANKPDALEPVLRNSVIQTLRDAFDSSAPEHPLQYEIARLLAMLGADDRKTVEVIASAIDSSLKGSHPTHDAHYLFCLAQMPGLRTGSTMKRISGGFAQIDSKLNHYQLLPDRNWTTNIRNAFQVHLQLSPGADRDFINHVSAHSAYLVEVLPKELHKAAAEKVVNHIQGWNPTAIKLTSTQLSVRDHHRLLIKYRDIWITNVNLRPHLAGILTKYGSEADKKLVEEFYRPPASTIDLTPFNEKMKTVQWDKGDIKRGQASYARFNCVTCHTGGNRLGPHLKNIAKRFSRDDLFRHINEPNLALSDLYKATQITTQEGTYVGVKVYSSEAQTILQTGSGETIRFSRHDILSERTPNQSPMPPGLLLTARPEDLADLYAYMKTL